ncbi:MAG TPA: TonB family protein [Pyrinomonadaceae bacterium]
MLSSSTRAQQQPASDALLPETARGVELYRQGKFAEAVEALKKASESGGAEAWHFLGLAYKQQGKRKEARGAFEQAILVRMGKLSPHVPAETLKAYGELNQEERARRLARLAASYKEAAETVAEFVSLNPEEADFWQAQLSSLHYYATHLASPTSTTPLYAPADVTTPAQILRREYPLYTERARHKQRRGTVALRVTLGSDGTVQHILVLKWLPDGLTGKAVDAARATKFTPAVKDGRPVSVWATLEYNFNIY